MATTADTIAESQRLLPQALAAQWACLPLPAWVAECCGLSPTAVVGDLARPVIPRDSSAKVALQFFLGQLLRTRLAEITHVPIFPKHVLLDPESLKSIAWPTRARNTLSERGMLNDTEKLASLTYGQALDMQRLGVKSVIELGLAAESLPALQAQVISDASTYVDDETVAALKRISSAEWADLVSGADPRFHDLIQNNGDSLAAIADTLVSSMEYVDASRGRKIPTSTLERNIRNASSLSFWAQEIESRVSRIHSLTLEDSLRDILEHCSGLKGSRRDALLARFGWSGMPHTLEEAGQLISVTRERIRQIESRVRERLPGSPIYAPALTRALQVLADAAPVQVDKVPAVLRANGITRVSFSAESVIDAARDLHIDAPIQVAQGRGVRFVTLSASTSHVSAILVSARKKAGSSGVVSAHDIASEMSRRSDVECSPEDVKKTLLGTRRFRVLCESWFWATDIPERRNRLVNVCKNMLSVTAPISVTRLRDGIRREYTFRNLSGSGRFDLRVPPADVLRAFLGDHPDFAVDDDDNVRPIDPLDYRLQLGQTDRIIVDVLSSSPSGVLDRATIIREAVRRGANIQTVNIDLTYSCLLEHIDTNIWTLRGSDVNPAAIEALREANAMRPRERRIRDFGWTADGNLWVAAVVPPITQPFVFNCPPGCRRYLAGHKFPASLRDGTSCGRLGVTDDGSVYGFSTFRQLSNCDPGDIVIAEFNLGDSRATLILGNDELIDLYCPE